MQCHDPDCGIADAVGIQLKRLEAERGIVVARHVAPERLAAHCRIVVSAAIGTLHPRSVGRECVCADSRIVALNIVEFERAAAHRGIAAAARIGLEGEHPDRRIETAAVAFKGLVTDAGIPDGSRYEVQHRVIAVCRILVRIAAWIWIGWLLGAGRSQHRHQRRE